MAIERDFAAVLLIASVSLLVGGCGGGGSSAQVPFEPMAVYLADTSSCIDKPPNRRYAQAAFFRLPQSRKIPYTINQRDANGNTVPRQRLLQRGALYMGGRDASGQIRGEMWVYDFAVSQRIADPGHPECPWYGFDVGGPARAEGSLAFDQDTALFHLIGGVETTQNGGERTVSTALTLDALQTPLPNWANPPVWTTTPVMGLIEDQILAYGAEICIGSRPLNCTDVNNSSIVYWDYDIESCSADYQGDVLECYSEVVPVGNHAQACSLDPECLAQSLPPVCLPQENCGRVPRSSDPAAWSWQYEGRGRSAMASAYSQQTGTFTMFGGHSGCVGPDCVPMENYPLFLSTSQNLKNRSTTHISQWDTRVGSVQPNIAQADMTRISAAGADWLGYEWVAHSGRWERTNMRAFAAIAGGTKKKITSQIKFNHFVSLNEKVTLNKGYE